MFPCELSEVWPVIVAMAAILAAGCVPLAMFLRDRQLYLEQRHAERMKALEMGSTIAALDPPSEQAAFLSNAFWIAFWMGAGLPITATSAAAWATRTVDGLGYVLAIWISVAAVCITGVVCATVIVLCSRPGRSPA